MAPLVGVGEHHQFNEVTKVVPGGDELLRDVLQRLWVPHLVVGGEVVEGFHEAASDEFGPDSVDESACEEGVGGIGDKVG